jgi:hypothetical protein
MEIHYESSKSSIKSLERNTNLNGSIRFRVFPRESFDFLELFCDVILDGAERVDG